MRDTTVVQRELVALSRAFELLPSHDLLIVPPLIQRRSEGVAIESDPVEAVFPAGEYGHVMSSRGIQPGRIIDLESWLGAFARNTAPPPPRSTLVYLGATNRMFLPAEIRAGVVPPSLERQPLATLRTIAHLELVHTFRLATQQHPGVTMRLAADRVDEVELGFYWLRLQP